MDLLTEPAGPSPHTAGDYLRTWRRHRHISQLDLALDAGVSQRHLSFVESGRAAPSRTMLLKLAEMLEVPLRDRNTILLAAGYAPAYGEHRLDDPAMTLARQAVERVLQGHEPYPALAVDRHWNLLMANSALSVLLGTVTDQALLTEPINVLRLSLHPKGLAPSIINLDEWRDHLLERLRHQVAATHDVHLAQLLEELAAPPYSPIDEAQHATTDRGDQILVPLRLATPVGELSFLSTTTVFGTPRDILLSELAIEAFFPADDATRQRLGMVQVPSQTDRK